GRYKVFMIDEAHQLTKDAFNALLKTLEEPPEYLKFVLATTDPEKMLPTVLSRCLQFNLRPMAPDTVQHHLAHVLQSETIEFETGALRLLARAARGSMRDALSLTDQAIAYGGGTLQESAVRAMLGVAREDLAAQVLRALGTRDGASVLRIVQQMRDSGSSAASILEQMAHLLQGMAMEQAVPGSSGADDQDSSQLRALAQDWAPDETQLAYSIVLHGRAELSLLADEFAAFTMVLLRFLAFPPAASSPAGTARSAPLRAPAPPSMVLPATKLVAPVSPVPAVRPLPPVPQEAVMPAPPRSQPAAVSAEPAAVTVHAVDAALGDRWDALVRQWIDGGLVSGLTRELAWQAGLESVRAGPPPVWTLRVEHESLRSAALQEKLQALLAQTLGDALKLELVPGTASDTPARREAALRAQRQQAAEAAIRQDPGVIELLKQYKSARVVPGSVKPR
ncbi:MAG: polymerase gamma/tau subunit DnaX, partial [Pseudomonadota bacterium]